MSRRKGIVYYVIHRVVLYDFIYRALYILPCLQVPKNGTYFGNRTCQRENTALSDEITLGIKISLGYGLS